MPVFKRPEAEIHYGVHGAGHHFFFFFFFFSDFLTRHTP